MRPDLQRQFNQGVTAEGHAAFISALESRLGLPIQFRVCEMPIIISQDFAREMARAAQEIIQECLSAENLRRSEDTLQARYAVRDQSSRPLFSVVDFAVTIDEHGSYLPRLIELQGFPSLFGYQMLLTREFIERYDLRDMVPFLSDLSEEGYCDLLRMSIFGDHDPDEVALVEIDPEDQKTRPDFVAMQRLIGVRTVNIRDVSQSGRRLFWKDADGKVRPLRRIFNRAIIDELDELGVKLQFSWNDDLDVEWAGHPNWYFRISKFLLPHLRHRTVPRSIVVRDITQSDLQNIHAYVLKPLYAFAGKGVNVRPTVNDVMSIPVDQHADWILQERVEYASCVPTPVGDNYVEIRIMLIWPDTCETPVPVMTLARTGRGPLMGARYNVAPWTGSSGCLIARDTI